MIDTVLSVRTDSSSGLCMSTTVSRPEADRDQLEVALDTAIDGHKEYLTLMAGVEARRRDETVEVEAMLVEKAEPPARSCCSMNKREKRILLAFGLVCASAVLLTLLLSSFPFPGPV